MDKKPLTGRHQDRTVAEGLGYRVIDGFGEFDKHSGRLIFTHGLKDFKESEACICEMGLFRLRHDTDGQEIWEEVPHFSEKIGSKGVGIVPESYLRRRKRLRNRSS